MLNPRFLLASALVGLVSLASTAAAQCPHPDGLDGGPCCSPAQAHLPKLPSLKQEALDICWWQCDLDAIGTQTVEWKIQNPAVGTVGCEPLHAKLRMTDAAGAVTWRGRMLLTYSRTWLEVDPTGMELQVWRFLVNGDLNPTPDAGGAPCPVPPCCKVFGRARYTGYLDYAFECGSGKLSNAVWMLTHACDGFEHRAGFPRGGAFHPDRGYTFVGPAAQFTPAPLVPIEGGGGPFEAVRGIRWGMVGGQQSTPTCMFEEQIQHQLSPVSQVCACDPNGLPQIARADVIISGACGTTAQTSPNALVPGFNSMGLGRFSDPTIYPGVEGLRWNAAGYFWADACSGNTRDEAFFGVTTLGGYPAKQILSNGVGSPLPPIFIDQGNSTRSGKTILNVPYVSDHIVNLNH